MGHSGESRTGLQQNLLAAESLELPLTHHRRAPPFENKWGRAHHVRCQVPRDTPSHPFISLKKAVHRSQSMQSVSELYYRSFMDIRKAESNASTMQSKPKKARPHPPPMSFVHTVHLRQPKLIPWYRRPISQSMEAKGVHAHAPKVWCMVKV